MAIRLASYCGVLVLLCALLLPMPANASPDSPPDAASLMERSHRTTLIKGSRLEFTLELRSANGTVRTRKVSGATRLQAGGVDNSRISRFEYPADAKGLATLLVEHGDRADDVWLYVPAIKKTRRVIADGKRDSFMGTVLSYGDVIGHRPSKWQHRIVGEDTWEKHACWMVESLPADDTARDESGYSKRLSCIDRETTFNWKMDTWDLDGKPLKAILNRQVKTVPEQPGAFVAFEMEALNAQTGDSTRLSIQKFEFAPDLPETDFSASALEREE
ncbi:MAG: outer membrane lipoprotein-sorting protein [Panacagrimonas sp.]